MTSECPRNVHWQRGDAAAEEGIGSLPTPPPPPCRQSITAPSRLTGRSALRGPGERLWCVVSGVRPSASSLASSVSSFHPSSVAASSPCRLAFRASCAASVCLNGGFRLSPRGRGRRNDEIKTLSQEPWASDAGEARRGTADRWKVRRRERTKNADR
ncbi:hypothetical protein K456DRAFT_454196 [Colletotrichum gloeosporioides 23]|nr:hypothetical protein K456DRAFT_454196 [Colletotrichum gloeosporioides 23]